MATLNARGIALYYETHGDRGNPPLLLIAGLGGAGSSWGDHVARFAKDFFVVLPDHRGTGRSARTLEGCTIAQHAADMAALLDHLELGPAHVAGTSTGGAIAQVMALDHAPQVRSVVMTSSFARADSYLRREFALRRKLAAGADAKTIYDCYALFLFSPRYAGQHPDRVAAWIERTASHDPTDLEREIAVKRIDMIMAHDAVGRLGDIRQPSLVVCGDDDFCTPLHLSEEIARGIPGVELAVLPGGGHFIHDEQPDLFFETVRRFLVSH